MILTIFFCPDCGSPLWKEATAELFKGFKVVQAGTLTESEKLNDGVDAELYTTTRAPWLVALSGADQRAEF